MSVARKSIIILAASLVASVFSIASSAGVLPTAVVQVPVKAILPIKAPPPPVQVCIPAFFAPPVCVTVS